MDASGDAPHSPVATGAAAAAGPGGAPDTDCDEAVGALWWRGAVGQAEVKAAYEAADGVSRGARPAYIYSECKRTCCMCERVSLCLRKRYEKGQRREVTFHSP